MCSPQPLVAQTATFAALGDHKDRPLILGVQWVFLKSLNGKDLFLRDFRQELCVELRLDCSVSTRSHECIYTDEQMFNSILQKPEREARWQLITASRDVCHEQLKIC